MLASPVIDVADYTGFPEMLDGRVKTLHPKVHGGILARRDLPEHVATMSEHGLPYIDLVCVNLYPFVATVSKPHTLDDAIENIDIGGPAMVRSSAKNYRFVAIVTDPADYPALVTEMQANSGALTDATRFGLAKKAFTHTAEYDGHISNYLTALNDNNEREAFGDKLNLQFTRAQICRYGENPHQAGAFYVEANAPAGTIATARQIQGKELSYNNIADTDAALECVKLFDAAPACVIVKHANPCGVAYGTSLLDAYNRAYQTDPESAFGGIIAFNGRLDGATAQAIVERQFVEVIIAPEVSPEAVAAVAAKKNVRLLECGAWSGSRRPARHEARRRRPAGAGRRRAAARRTQDRHQPRADRAGNGRSAVRLARRQIRQVQRHCLCPRPHDRRRRRGADEPHQFGPHRRDQGRTRRPAGARLGDGIGCLLPLPRRHRPGCGGGHQGGDPARRLDARRRSHRRRQRTWHRDGVYRHAAFPALILASGER